jgi:hypothetical protein
MQQMLFGGGGFGVGGDIGSLPPPADTRPPGERLQVQLQNICHRFLVRSLFYETDSCPPATARCGFYKRVTYSSIDSYRQECVLGD